MHKICYKIRNLFFYDSDDQYQTPNIICSLKVVPPPEWVARKEGYDKLKFEVKSKLDLT